MEATRWLGACGGLNVFCWLFILKIMGRGWQRNIKNLTLRRIVTIGATVFALPTTVLWALAYAAKTVWDELIYPAAQEYAKFTGIRKEDA